MGYVTRRGAFQLAYYGTGRASTVWLQIRREPARMCVQGMANEKSSVILHIVLIYQLADISILQ